jgi:hypothetical protein
LSALYDVSESFESRVNFFFWFSENMAFFWHLFWVCQKVLTAKSTLSFGLF